MTTLAQAELLRYSRHLILPDVGIPGQEKLKAARVLLIGAGGLGSPAALYLAAAGVGTLGLVDFDNVDVTNLQRQILHGTKDVGRPKLLSARERIADVNPHVRLETYETALTSKNALDILSGYDIVVDGTDNFATRYLVNDACVLGVLPGLVGTIQATETIKLIVGAGEPLKGRLLLIDTLGMQFRTVNIRKDPACPACGTREIRSLIDYEQLCGVRTAEAEPRAVGGFVEITPRELQSRLSRGEELQLIDVREQFEWDIAHIDGARLVPLATLPEVVDTLYRNREVVLYCKGWTRSRAAASHLADAGFARVTNLTGGILRWQAEVDPTLPRY